MIMTKEEFDAVMKRQHRSYGQIRRRLRERKEKDSQLKKEEK